MSQMPSRRPTSNNVWNQDGSIWGNGSSNFNNTQNQIRQRASSMTSAFPSRSRSGASSNLSSTYSSPLARRYSSASSDTISEPGTGDGTDMRNSYYQVQEINLFFSYKVFAKIVYQLYKLLFIFSIISENERKK